MNGTFIHRIGRGFTLRNAGTFGAVLVLVMLALLTAGVPVSHAAPGGTGQDAPTVVKVGQDVMIPAGDVVSGVFVAGGNVTVNGTADGVVAVGGDVTVNGAVDKGAVAVGGDVRVVSGASVGSELKPDDKAIVSVGGKTFVQPGASVTGKVSRIDGQNWSAVGDAVLIQGPSTWDGWRLDLILGIACLAFLMVAAVIAVAALPRQMAAVKEQVRGRFWASLGWGALTVFVIVPAIVLALIISIVGLLPLIFLVAPALFLVGSFGLVCVAGVIGDRVMAGDGKRGNAVLVAVVGVLILGLVGLIPVAGDIVMAVAGIVGIGATLLAIGRSQRERRERSTIDTSTPQTA